MRAEDAELATGQLAAAVRRAGSLDEKLRAFAQQLVELPVDDQVVVMHTIGARAAEDPVCGQLLVLLVDVNGFRSALGADRFERFRQTLGRQPHGAVIERHLRSLSGVEPGQLSLLRAKTAVMLQTVAMLNDRFEGHHLPQVKLDGYELAERVLTRSGLEDARLRVELGELSRAALTVARNVLLDADLEEVDEDTFETTVTDEQIKTLGQVSGLGRAVGRGAGVTLSEAVIQRQALLIIKRFCLLCRSATMYPPDHPSLPPAYDGFRSMIEAAVEGKEQATLTVLSGDILIDDVKIRKEDRFKKTFVDLFDERQVSSLTFRPGLTVEEVKALVAVFVESPKAVKEVGGARAILTRKNVANILVDQFRYRVVADDGTVVADQRPATADHLLESVLYSHVLDKIERGGGIQSLSVEEVGAFFKDVLTSPDEDKRRALARLLLTLDPELLERGLLANPEVRRTLSWSAARRTLDVMFRELAQGDHETREQALETIAQLTELAIVRQKETTVALITRRLCEYLGAQESDPDLLRKAAQVFAAIAIGYVRRRRLDKAAEVLDLLAQVSGGREEVSLGRDATTPPLRLLSGGSGELREAARVGLETVGHAEDVVDLVLQALADPDSVRNQPASTMLEALGTDVVVTRLFRLFLDRDRSVRSRAYRLLKKLGPRSLALLRHETDERKLPTHPGRDPVAGVFQEDSEWYILRNCMGLLAELDPGGSGSLLLELAADPDPRVRRESLRLITRHGLPGGVEVLRAALTDARAEVREAGIMGVGALRDEEAVGSLIDVLYRFPEHRKIALEALGHIASIRCVDFLLTAVDAIETAAGRKRKRVRIMPDFPADRDAILLAIATLGTIGGFEVENRFDQFLASWSGPLSRWSLRPGLKTLAPHEFLGPVENALALAKRRRPIKTKAGDMSISGPPTVGSSA